MMEVKGCCGHPEFITNMKSGLEEDGREGRQQGTHRRGV